MHLLKKNKNIFLLIRRQKYENYERKNVYQPVFNCTLLFCDI